METDFKKDTDITVYRYLETMSTFAWDSETHAVLRDETRKLQFDFEKIATSIRGHFSHLICEVTANDCRIAYAQEYLSQTVAEESEPINLEIEDSMTFEEIMDVVEIRNERSEMRKQKIFSRVLASLGNPLEAMVIDVKVGSGAFMRDEDHARALANALVKTGNACGIRTRALLTDMNQPLGRAVGNSLEVKECIELLRGEIDEGARPVLDLSL